MGHLLVRDFIPYSWRGGDDTQFQVWLAENAIRELSNPSPPAHTEGSALDRVPLLPGSDTPWELRPPEPDVNITFAGEGREPWEEYFCRRSQGKRAWERQELTRDGELQTVARSF